MEQILSWFSIELFRLGDGVYTLGRLALLLTILIVYFILGRILVNYVKRTKKIRSREMTEELRSSLLLTIRSVLLLIVFISILLSLPSDKLFQIDQNSIHVIDLINIVIVFLLARGLVWYFKRWFKRLSDEKKVNVDKGRTFAISQIFSYIIYILAVLLALSSLKIDINLIIASTAGLFVGLGLALQHTFDDIISGVIILFDRTLEIDDMVEIDTLSLEGRVKEIKLRTTIIETLDNITVIVPNSKITKTNVVNWTFNDRGTRFKIKIGVAYGSDLSLVRKALLASADSHGKVLNKPAPIVRFVNFGDSALEFELLFWTRTEGDIYNIKSDLRFKIDAEFRRHRISIPFPQRDIHVVSDFRRETEKPDKLDKATMESEKAKPEENGF
ncbi:MAG: mechanosensitive ion channel domain-containing protein [Bacteroidota bacterium]